MQTVDDTNFVRVPGLYRAWDLQFVLNRTDDYRVHYLELTEGGTPLYGIYRRADVEPEVAS